MTDALFRPFDLKKWFVVGFTAWLAGLGSRGGGSGTNIGSPGNADDLAGGAGDLWQQIVANGLLLALVTLGCAVLLVVIVAVLWVSSRGKFMFLDNVVFNRALVVDPWNRFRKQGNSLFFFRIAFGLSCLVVLGGLVLAIAGTVGLSFWQEIETAVPMIVIGLVAAGVFAILIFVILYAAFFLDAFVVPLMHRYDLGALDGWRRFLDLFRKRAWAFLLCGLLVIIFGLGVLFVVIGFGLMTCCLGFLLLIIPYIGSVVMLPISVLYRRFTFEFLAQFDPGLLPEEAPDDIPSGSPVMAPPA